MKTTFNQNKLKGAIVSAMLIATGALSVPAYATTATANMTVTASIGTACTVTTQNIVFGEYKPTTVHASSDLIAQGGITHTCTVGTTGKVIIGQGSNASDASTDATPLRFMAASGVPTKLRYDVFSNEGRTASWKNVVDSGVALPTSTGVAQIMPVYGKIAGGQTNIAAGSYSDVLAVTVDY
jgi:spore coat protein U-like protein|tara:strand:- start:111 stop:656 length:546 start_codon:yes stop_codon:yes gene_type:complete